LPRADALGYSLLELVFVVAVGVTASAVAVPQYLAGLDDFRTSGAARYLSTRFQRARMEAVMRSTSVAIQFIETASGYEYAVYMDGNGNGVLTREIESGVDRRVGAVESLRAQFTGVDFGTVPGLPPVDPSGTAPGTDPIRLGASSLARHLPARCTSGAAATRSTRCASSATRGRRGC
jgi:hypothetical protein